MSKKYPFLMRYVIFLAAVMLTIYAVIIAKGFLYPVAFGILLAYLLFPVANYLEKHHFPRILSILISIILAIAVLGGGIYFIYTQVGRLVSDFPALKKQALQNIELLQHTIGNAFGVEDKSLETLLKNWVTGFFEGGSMLFNTIFSATTGTLLKIGLMPVYIFLFLYYRTKFAYFILKIVPEKKEFVTVHILRDISTVATRYMGGVIIVVSILCILNSFGLYIAGMHYPVIFGVISALFNFIPYFGTLMGGAVPLLFALLTGESLSLPFRVILVFIVIQFIENNILTPNIVGGSLKINPFFIIFSLIIGATIWGIPGMLVIVPFLAMAKIIFKNIEALQPYSYLLGTRGTRRHAISIQNIKISAGRLGAFYKRVKKKISGK